MRIANKKSKGFTLFEVLIALAIVAIALATLVKAARANANNAAYLRDKAFAQWVAVNQFTTWRLEKAWLATGEKKGNAIMGGNDWFWLVKVTQNKLFQDIRDLEFRVYRTEENRDDNKLPVYRMIAFQVKPP